jgi:hypothetical protein
MNSIAKTKAVRIGVSVVIGALAMFAFAYSEQLKSVIRTVLDSKWSTGIVGIYIFTCALIHQIFNGIKSESSGLIYSQFGRFADFVFSLFAYLPASTAALALLKGLYMQHFFDGEFFKGFDQIDLLSIVVVSAFLLYYSLNRSTILLITAIQSVEASPVKTSGPDKVGAG